MSSKSLVTGAALAVSCLLFTGAAQAQSPLNPFTWFAPSNGYGPAYGQTPYCPNGNCGVKQANYYQPGYANCPNGNCGVAGNCANGQCALTGCANGRCAPSSQYGYPNGIGTVPFNGARTPAYYAPMKPVYPTQPLNYNTYRPTYNGWNTSSTAGSTRMFNSANSPFYP